MGKRDKVKRALDGLWSRPSTKPISTSSGTSSEPRLIEPANRAFGTASTNNQSQAAPPRDLWSLALQKLSSEDKKAISPILSDSKLEILRNLRAEAVKKRTACENKRWKFELNGRQIILRDVAEKIVFWIDKFKEIGDIAVNFDPVHASLPWAGMRFLLEITVAESQQMGALLTGVEKLTHLIGRCQIYETLYLNREPLELGEWEQAATNLTSALVALYATMLIFLARAIRAYNQGTIRRTLDAIFLKSAEVIGFLKECQTLEITLEFEAENCERIHTRSMQASSEELIPKLKQILGNLETAVLRTDPRVAALYEKQESDERLKILDWISATPYEEHHNSAVQGRTSGTGKWLLQHERYREWRVSSASTILWLHGEPGAGKTKLVSTVVDHLLQTFEQCPNDEAFAYFYCDRNQPGRREPAMILNSLLRQLSTSRDNDAILSPTVQVYQQKRQKGFVSGMLQSKESQTVLAELFQIYPQTTLVVDALDECDKETRVGFINMLKDFVAESSNPVKILISSRRDRDIECRFENGLNLKITAGDIRDDIAVFVSDEIIARDKDWQVEISSELKELIHHTLVERSEGMFQWVALQISALREFTRERDIRNWLGKLPDSLKATYDELYCKIQSQKASTPVIANRAFQWVMCSCRPLSPAELVAAVCQDPDTDEIDKIDIDIKTVLGACQNLLVVNQELNFCRFSHLSVQEYFETHHWVSYEYDCLVGKVCLLLLMDNSITSKQYTMGTGKESKPESAHAILKYACFNWVTHLQRIEKKGIVESRLTALLKRFLGSMDQSSLAYQNWHKMVGDYLDSSRLRRHPVYRTLPSNQYHYQNHRRLTPCSRASLAIVIFGFHKIIIDWWTVGFADIHQKNSSGESLFLLGAIGGSISIVEDLLRKGADIYASSEFYDEALPAASYFGHQSIVQLLLDKGANANASGVEFDSALSAASYSGHESIVRLLLNVGTEVNASGGKHGSALQAASYAGHESIVQMLLENGADIQSTGGDHPSALIAASHRNNQAVVRLLLSRGADINASDRTLGNALQAASISGAISVVRTLLDSGADVNALSGSYDSALKAASLFGHKSIVQLLIDEGADVNASGGYYGNALSAASHSGHGSIVQLLLEKGANANVSRGRKANALQEAARSGEESIVQQLLDMGADVNMSGGEYGNALQAASCSGVESLVRLLLERGADVNALGGRYGNALTAASSSGHRLIVQLLLGKGADVNMPGGQYGNALCEAATFGRESVVQLLLENGAEVNVSGERFNSALVQASGYGRDSIVKLLLNKGADINASGGISGSALHKAVSMECVSTVQLLLDEGADVNVAGGRYGTALQAASYRGYESIVQLLLNKEADVNASGGEYGSALQAASFSDSASIQDVDSDEEAGINGSGGEFGSPLQAASYSKHEKIVQMLLDRGADVNASGGEFGSALQGASYANHESIVRMLLDRGADVNTAEGTYGSALEIASSRGYEAISELLQAAMKPPERNFVQLSS